MIVEKLRNSIISYAIQGRLLERDNRLEFVDEKYIKNGEKKGNSQGLTIKIEDLNIEIPDNWRWVNLEQITELITCGHASTPNYVEKGYPFLSAKNVKPSKFLFEDHKFISDDLYYKLTKKNKPEIGDLLITRVGAGIGEACIIDKAIDFAIYVSLTLVKPINDVIDSKFLLYYIQSNEVQNRFKTDTYGKKASQGNLNVAKVRKLPIPLPPLSEQKRIVEKLDEILPLIDSLEKDEIKLNDLMQQFPNSMKTSILQAAIQGKITEQKIMEGDAKDYFKQGVRLDIDDYPFEIPDNWTFVKMKHLMSIQTGKKDANFGTSNGKYDFFTCALEPIKADSYSYEGESILLPGNGANVGVAIYYNGKFEAYQRTYILQRMNNYILMKYLYYHLMANWKSFNKEKQYGSAIPYIKTGNLTEYPVAVPPLKEQLEIVKKLENTIPYIETIDHD